MKGELQTMVMTVLGIVILLIMISTVIIPQAVTTKKDDLTNITISNEHLGTNKLFTTLVTANQTATFLNVPIIAGSYVVTNSTGFTLASTSYSLNVASGLFNMTNSSHNGQNLSATYNYTKTNWEWDSSTSAVWLVIGVAVVLAALIFIFSWATGKL